MTEDRAKAYYNFYMNKKNRKVMDLVTLEAFYTLGKKINPVIERNKIPGLNVLDEWIKWLSYGESQYRDSALSLFNKPAGSLSIKELGVLLDYNTYQKYADLFRKYKNLECDKNEALDVYKFMIENNLSRLELMLLTSKDMDAVQEKVECYGNLYHDDLFKLINKSIADYENIPIEDAYLIRFYYDNDLENDIVEEKNLKRRR